MSVEPEALLRRQVGAIVLAAGRSARMGEAKQLLRIQGRTLLELTLEHVRRSAVDEVVLVLGHEAEQIRSELPPELLEGVTAVVNEGYSEGMSSSLRVGFAALGQQVDAALIVLADQPFVRPETMNTILSAYQQSSAAAVVPYYEGKRGNPVLLDRSLFDEARALAGDVGFREILARHAAKVQALDVSDEGVALDIDSRDDYDRLRDRTA